MRAKRRDFLRLMCTGGGLAVASLSFTESSVSSVSASHGGWEKPRHGSANTADGGSGPEEDVRELWLSDTDVVGTPVIADGAVYVADPDGAVRAFDSDDGTTRWEFEVDGTFEAPVSYEDSAGGAVYVTAAPVTYALDAEDGAEIWRHRGTGLEASAANVAGGAVYVGKSTRVYALGVHTGTVLWDYEAEGVVSATPAVAGGTVYAVDGDGYLYALDSEDGFPRWVESVSASVSVAPVVKGDAVFVVGRRGRVRSFERWGGDGRWLEELYTQVDEPPAVDNDHVYVATEEGNLHALRTSNGREEWSFEPDGSPASAPAVGDGIAYVGVDDTLYAVDTENGEEVWRHEAFAVSSPAVFGDNIYVGSASGLHTLRGGTPSPEIEITDIALSDRTVSVGETVGVAVYLENTGEEEGKFPVSLYVDGNMVESKEAVVRVEEKQEMEFTTVFGEPGEHDLGVNAEDSVTVIVTGDGGDEDTEDEESVSGSEEDTKEATGDEKEAAGGGDGAERGDGATGGDGTDGEGKTGVGVVLPGLGISAVVAAVGGTVAAVAFKIFRAVKSEDD